ncbi:MAG: hypothetical protein MNPFHGCM_03178 [Gemmatimonadaceae bacterium]|nr:hypothetical protein [Gemmatimonadaceae bacterium]
MSNDPSPVRRRSFVSRLASGIAAFGVAASPARAQGQPIPADRWEARRHPQDDWLEQIPGAHRYFFDTSSANGAGDGITFATNYFVASKSGYGLEDSDLAVVLCLRHFSTPFAYSDAIWAKYGAVFADRLKFVDPKTNVAPTVNVYQQKSYGMTLPNRGTTFEMLAKRGVRFAVCDMATHAFAGMIAAKHGLRSESVYQELRGNDIGSCHFIPAGIVAVNRAQERGYSIISMH